jgi:polyphosphate kinase 2 (PPK2 family)
VGRLQKLQEKLYAQNRWGLLLIFQAMDAAGKDGAIKHVMSGINPQGCQVFSFKAPSAEDLDHDFLRTKHARPSAAGSGFQPVITTGRACTGSSTGSGCLGARHQTALAGALRRHQRLRTLRRETAWRSQVLLHVSRGEQKRFMRRLEEPRRNWKFSLSDTQEQSLAGYMRLRGHDPAHQLTAPGSSCRPTTSGSRVWRLAPP